MSFKNEVVSIGTTDTDIHEMGAGLEGAVVLGVGNATAGAITTTIKFYKQSLGTTTTLVSGKSIAANDFVKIAVPIAMEAGDKIIMSGVSAGLRAFATVTDSSSIGSGGAWNPRGEYSAVATYAKRDVVYVAADGKSYISLQDSNTGNTPSTQPSFWMINADRGEDGDAGTVASDTVAGIVELATSSEVATGTDTARAVTPAGAAAVYSRITRDVNAQTGTTYTLALTDSGKVVTFSNAAAITLTIPTNATVAFPVNTQIDLIQLGAGKVTVSGSGVTINSVADNKSIAAQYGGVSLLKTATDTWLLMGALTT